jgi:PBP1b-binding outer membrane lipoprotein LpoB
MKAILAVLALVVVLAACHESMQSTEVKTDSTAVVVDSISVDTTKELVDSIK